MDILLGLDLERGILVNRIAYTQYLPIEVLRQIESLLKPTIEFALKNDIEKLNEEYYEWSTKAILEYAGRVPKSIKNKTFIYLIHDKGSNAYKIGVSTNPEKRMKSIKSASAHAELLFYLDGDEYNEKFLHDKFTSKRIRGEWFNLSTEDVEYIKSGAWKTISS